MTRAADVTNGDDCGPTHALAVRCAANSHLVCAIPMYNEANHARRFLHELHTRFAERFRSMTIIAVDDGSSDATAQEVHAAIAEGLPIHLIRLSRNFGKEVALTAGLAATERLENVADVILIMDSDFQHPFSAVASMISRWEAGIDMVYGVQTRREAASTLRRSLTRGFYRLLTSSNDRVQIPPDAGDFRLLDRKVVSAINRLPERNRYMKGLYAWVGFSSEGVAFEALPRAGGDSSFGLRRLVELALDGITAFTSWPLRLASICGVFVSFAAFLYGCWIIVERFWIGQPIPGFATLAAAIMFFSGLQLMSIGLLGEYLGRVFVEVKGRPLYIVAEEVAPHRSTETPTMTTDRVCTGTR